MVLKELKDRGNDDVFMYMHMQETDFGGSVLEMAKSIGVEFERDFTIPNPQQFGAHSGFPVEMLNQIYNASDVYLSTTHGEGWGLTITEAMATKLPVVAPDNTSVPEILGDDRGWRVPSGHTPSHWIIKENDNERMRPLMDVEAAADAIEFIKNNSAEVDRRVENAYEWIQKNTWEEICKQWLNVFNRASNKTLMARKLRG